MKTGERVLLQALMQIANPIKHLQEEAQKAGHQIDGMAAVQYSNDPNTLKQIAANAIEEYNKLSTFQQMTITQAVQHAEMGKLITCTSYKRLEYFIAYAGRGVFYLYEYIPATGKTKYKYEVREFGLSQILDNGWEIWDKCKINP